MLTLHKSFNVKNTLYKSLFRMRGEKSIHFFQVREMVQCSNYKGGLDLRAKFVVFILKLNQSSTHFARCMNSPNY